MSAIPFTRSLGARSGVQLNYVKDSNEGFVPGDGAQAFGAVGRFTRGRIDRAISVPRDQLTRMLGAAVSPSVNALNEGYIHVYEAFQNGAVRAVISRLVPAAASLKWMVASNPVAPEDPVWAVSPATTVPVTAFLLAVRHLECFNDAVRAEIHAIEAVDGDGDPVASKEVRLRLLDADFNELFNFTGSLDPAAKDDFGNSYYLPNVVSGQTDDLEVVVAANASVPVASPFYGRDSTTGLEKIADASLVYFTEGGTTYTPADVDRAIAALRSTIYPYGYLSMLGSQSTLVISKLGPLASVINKQLVGDIPGNLSVDAAITFAQQFNFDSHYVQWYWAPLKALDPVNGGKSIFGVSGAQIGLRCQRNAQTDANGVPPKNFPVAGKNWPLVRSGIVQVVSPSEDEDLEKLAKARINPVIFQAYNDGNAFVFFDSLTSAKTSGDRKLIAVAEMSSQVDDWVTAAAKGYLQLPMATTIKRMTDFLQTLFEGLEAAKWIIPSASLENRSFVAQVVPNAQRPKDRVDVSYWLSYDGTTRAIYVQQTISK